MSEDQVKENQPTENQEEPIETVEAPQEETCEPVIVEAQAETTEPEMEAETEIEEAEEIQETQPEETLLLPRDTMLSAGIHIGTRMKTLDMEPFIYRVRPDGLFVLDVKKTDDRIRTTAKFLSRYDLSKVAVAATRLYAHEPVKMFCKLTGATPLIGRFIPGQLSNPQYKNRVDPEIILVSDPRADAQAVKEASKVGIPIEVQAKIFTPLMTTKAKGQGFGLSVVKRMTEAMDGTVNFESEIGKGTKFTLQFPA